MSLSFGIDPDKKEELVDQSKTLNDWYINKFNFIALTNK